MAVAFQTPVARILSQRSAIDADGQYSYDYAVDNGIQVEESGVGGQYATGRAAWVAPDGTPVEFTYTADENGYQASGPFVPKTPEHVLRALEYIRSHPAYDDSVVVKSTYKPVATYKPVSTFKQTSYKPVTSTFKQSTFQNKQYKQY